MLPEDPAPIFMAQAPRLQVERQQETPQEEVLFSALLTQAQAVPHSNRFLRNYVLPHPGSWESEPPRRILSYLFQIQLARLPILRCLPLLQPLLVQLLQPCLLFWRAGMSASGPVRRHRHFLLKERALIRERGAPTSPSFIGHRKIPSPAILLRWIVTLRDQ